jgi:hypothetical protein
VFVFGNRAIVGSTNASQNSKNWLIEAAIETTDPSAVKACRDFVHELTGDRIGPRYAKKLQKLYVPPKFPGGKGPITPRFRPLWVIPLVHSDWDPIDDRHDSKAEPEAKRRLRSRKLFVLNKFHWEGDDPLFRTLKKGHQIIQAMQEGKSHRLYPPSRVIHWAKYQKLGKAQVIVYLEAPRTKPAWRTLELVRKELGPLEKKLIVKFAAQRIRNLEMVRALLQLWPSLSAD